VVPGDGAVRVLYGGSDYAHRPFNDAVSGAVEAGTAMGPVGKLSTAEPLRALLRTAAPTPLHLASAYAALADGRYAIPYTVARITRAGRTVYRAHAEVQRVPGGRGTALAGAKEVFVTAGAGGGSTRRTVWATGYDSRLALTVALFADRAGSRKGTTVPAQLPNDPSPTAFAQSVAAGIRSAFDRGAEGSASPVPRS
jgi:hypothetical protein